jgi:hypothetical protein
MGGGNLTEMEMSRDEAAGAESGTAVETFFVTLPYGETRPMTCLGSADKHNT